MAVAYLILGVSSGMISVLVGILIGYRCGYDSAMKDAQRRYEKLEAERCADNRG